MMTLSSCEELYSQVSIGKDVRYLASPNDCTSVKLDIENVASVMMLELPYAYVRKGLLPCHSDQVSEIPDFNSAVVAGADKSLKVRVK